MANVFIDFSAANDGDGTAANQASGGGSPGAFKTIVGKTFNPGDKVWFRRAGTLTLAASLTFSVANVSYIGWPVPSGSTAAGADGNASTQDDEDYSTRPASGTSNSWDSDTVGTYPTISHNWTTSSFQIIISTGTGQQFKRLKFNQTGSGSVATISQSVTVPCSFKYTQHITAQVGNGQMLGLTHTFGNIRFDWCGFAGTDATYSVVANTAGGSMQNYDCYFTKTATTAAGQGMLLLGACWGTETIRAKMIDNDTTHASICCIRILTPTTLHSIIDCSLDVSTATAHGEYTLVIGGGNIFMRGMKLKGNVSLTSSLPSDPLSFAYIQQPFLVAAGAIDMTGIGVSSNIHVASFVPITGNTNDVTITAGTIITVGDFRPLAGTPITPAASKFPGVYSADYGHVAGAWRHDGLRAILTKNTSVTRTGGAAFSIKCVQTDNTAPNWYFAEYGIPGMETIFVSLASGARTVTLFGARTAFTTAPTQNDIWFEVSYLDLASGEHRKNISSRAGDLTGANILALTSDGSTWTGDASITTEFKIVLSFTTGQACVCPIRIRYKGYDSTGYTYLDPLLVVT